MRPGATDSLNDMASVLIIACGNPLRGDDAVAWHIAESLASHTVSSHAEIVTSQQLTPEMAEIVSSAESVVFVDASAAEPAGSVSLAPIAAVEDRSASMTHRLSPTAILAMSNALYGKGPLRAFLLTVGGKSFDLSQELSPAVSQAVPDAVERIEALFAKDLAARDPDKFCSMGRRGFTAVRADPRLAEAQTAVTGRRFGLGKHFKPTRGK
jgi:hydrogenase maturation protease